MSEGLKIRKKIKTDLKLRKWKSFKAYPPTPTGPPEIREHVPTGEQIYTGVHHIKYPSSRQPVLAGEGEDLGLVPPAGSA
jgi:hypothetical protein